MDEQGEWKGKMKNSDKKNCDKITLAVLQRP